MCAGQEHFSYFLPVCLSYNKLYTVVFPSEVNAEVIMTPSMARTWLMCCCLLQSSAAQLPAEELSRIQEYLQSSGLAQR